MVDKADISCEACEEFGIQQMLCSPDHRHPDYNLCNNCLLMLITLNLSKKQFLNLLKHKHTTKEFYLHEDFYDEETGKALQPVI